MAQDNKSHTLLDFRNSIEKPIDRNSEAQPEDSASNIGSENRHVYHYVHALVPDRLPVVLQVQRLEQQQNEQF